MSAGKAEVVNQVMRDMMGTLERAGLAPDVMVNVAARILSNLVLVGYDPTKLVNELGDLIIAYLETHEQMYPEPHDTTISDEDY